MVRASRAWVTPPMTTLARRVAPAELVRARAAAAARETERRASKKRRAVQAAEAAEAAEATIRAAAAGAAAAAAAAAAGAAAAIAAAPLPTRPPSAAVMAVAMQRPPIVATCVEPPTLAGAAAVAVPGAGQAAASVHAGSIKDSQRNHPVFHSAAAAERECHLRTAKTEHANMNNCLMYSFLVASGKMGASEQKKECAALGNRRRTTHLPLMPARPTHNPLRGLCHSDSKASAAALREQTHTSLMAKLAKPDTDTSERSVLLGMTTCRVRSGGLVTITL